MSDPLDDLFPVFCTVCHKAIARDESDRNKGPCDACRAALPPPVLSPSTALWGKVLPRRAPGAQAIVGVLLIAAWIALLLASRPASSREPQADVPSAAKPAPAPASPYRYERPDANLVQQVRVICARGEWSRSPTGAPEIWMSADWQNDGPHPIRQLYGRFEVRSRRGQLLLAEYDWAYYGDGSEEPNSDVPSKGVYLVRNLRSEGEPFFFERPLDDYDVTLTFLPTQAYATLDAKVAQGR